MDVCAEEGFEIAEGCTADPSTALRSELRSGSQGESGYVWKIGDLDGQSGNGPSATTADPSTSLRSVEKHFQEGTAEPQISPLRCASVEMTKGRAVLPVRVVAE